MSESTSKLKGLLWVSLGLLAAWLAVAGLPFFAKRVPWGLETKLAEQVSRFDEKKACHSRAGDASLLEMVDRLRLAPQSPLVFPVHVQIIKGETQNAYASLGGEIFIYEGLFAELQSADELAGVLAHELEHVQKRHIMEGMLNQLFSAGVVKFLLSGDGASAIELANTLSQLQFSRSQEAEADEAGLKRLQTAQIDPIGFQHFFERLQRENRYPAIISDHPSPKNRADRVRAYRVEAPRPALSSAQWEALKQICSQN